MENLRLADKKGQKGKKSQYGVRLHNLNQERNLFLLHESLINKTFTTSPYTIFKIRDPKERDVYRLPYYPDRIAQHAIMNVLESVFISTFTADTYSCIKGKGIHAAANAVKVALINDKAATTYCLKLDVKKFYQSIDHDILKTLLRKKIKDQDLLWLLDNIIDSADGVPIGNYLSQYFANFYLTYFDHWLKQEVKVKHYFRYADDLVILSESKLYLQRLNWEIAQYLKDKLKLTVKENYQVFPVASRGIDFVGYRFFHTHTFLRKSIKQNFARMLTNNPSPHSVAAYYGWAKHGNCKNLLKKLLADEKFQRPEYSGITAAIAGRQN